MSFLRYSVSWPSSFRGIVSRPSPGDVLSRKMAPNDAGATTIRDYLIELLKVVWLDGDIGKRPFGNSDWEREIYRELVAAGWVRGEFNEYEYLVWLDVAEADSLIVQAIEYLAQVPIA